MIFNIDEIPEEGLAFKVREDAAHFKIDQPDCSLCEDVRIEGTLKRTNDDVYLDGRIVTAMSLLCARCLEPLKAPVRGGISVRFVPSGPSGVGAGGPVADSEREMPGRHQGLAGLRRRVAGTGEPEAEYELRADDIDTEPYTENKIDLTHVVRDQILLAIPLATLCREDCRGLCSQCGGNLNKGACSCAGKKSIDPRLAILETLKDKLK